ncbi:MAG: hypothetical protein J5809_01020 [Selenomonadaceae bacterium]|nr:hypothetical protein [Selenomonadaceae bacterium]
MVKIERKDTEKSRLAISSLAKEKSKSAGKCNTPEVVDALDETFHGKCYICEHKSATSLQVEHLQPHNGDSDLKFDWENLFWACGHCNHIKSDSYTPILDCTKLEVDEFIAFRKNGFFGVEESLTFETVGNFDDPAIDMTCELLKRIHYGKTPQEKAEAKMLRHAIREEIHKFKEDIRDYDESFGEDKLDLFCRIKMELKSNSPFAAFKRWLVRDNPVKCADFIDCWK